MNRMSRHVIRGGWTLLVAVAIPVAIIAWHGHAQPSSASDSTPTTWTKPVPKASCGSRDRQETALQGQTSIAERMTGGSDRSYNCNLELVGQFRGEGASWQMAAFDTCAYYGTGNGPGQRNKGVVVIDA